MGSRLPSRNLSWIERIGTGALPFLRVQAADAVGVACVLFSLSFSMKMLAIAAVIARSYRVLWPLEKWKTSSRRMYQCRRPVPSSRGCWRRMSFQRCSYRFRRGCTRQPARRGNVLGRFLEWWLLGKTLCCCLRMWLIVIDRDVSISILYCFDLIGILFNDERCEITWENIPKTRLRTSAYCSTTIRTSSHPWTGPSESTVFVLFRFGRVDTIPLFLQLKNANCSDSNAWTSTTTGGTGVLRFILSYSKKMCSHLSLVIKFLT